MSFINITNLKKEFNNVVALDISLLDIKQGEVIGVVGNNGAGKTTLFRLMLDLIKPTAGTVEINGMKLANGDSWKATTGAYLDEHFLIKFLTASEFLSFIGSAYKLSDAEIESRRIAFEKFMTNEIIDTKKYIHEFSSGNKQKIGIVSAMITHPNLLILDEPFNFIDPTSQIELINLLKYLNSQYKTTIIISSHNIKHIVDVSSRIILMEKGKIIKDMYNDAEKVKSELQHYFEIYEQE